MLRLREIYGMNELVEEEVNPLLKFLSYFWGPMPIMIWAAIAVEVIKGSITGDGWPDVVVLFILQLVNGLVGYVEELNAGNAIAALKERLAPECVVIRQDERGRMVKAKIKSRELVPGDLVDLKLGDVVPADCIMVSDPSDPDQSLQVDQSALTGESLPVEMFGGMKIKMSSMIKQGEMPAVVVATGKNTFYGKAAELMKIEDEVGRFQKVLFQVTLVLLFLSLALCTVIFVVMLVNSSSGASGRWPQVNTSSSDFLRALSVVVVLMVASVPIATQVVCTSTMAVGSRRLAARKVIIARLSAIEELAGMTVLCSDKTGTLTLNELTLNEPRLFGDMTPEELIFHSALAANRKSANMDAIDKVIVESVPARAAGDPEDRWTSDKLERFEMVKYIPFNPTIKRTEAQLRAPDGTFIRVTKGAPQVVLNMCLKSSGDDPELKENVEAAIQDLSDRGYRSLGLAVSYSPQESDPVWRFEGVLSLFDPPRPDTASTIKAAVAGGVEVKMITGDHRAIAIETCRQLEMGTDIFDTHYLKDPTISAAEKSERIAKANGFAEVLPEDKFDIVQALRERNLVVGMTGDGVNDAPALKRADIGIAVHGATDAAKAAADIVLTEPGLSVIIEAIQRSRKIFQRMRNYAIYRIACTLQLLCFFFFAVISISPESESFYGKPPPAGVKDQSAFPCSKTGVVSDIPGQYLCAHDTAFVLPVLSMVIITILNDGTIITIAYDKVIPANTPQRWDLSEMYIVSIVLGLAACIGSLIILVYALQANPLQIYRNGGSYSFFGNLLGRDGTGIVTWGETQTIMYLKVSISDFLTVFAARTRGAFWERRPGYSLLWAFVFATAASTLLSCFWPLAFNDISYENAKPIFGLAMLMGPLNHNPYAVITVWVYCILGYIVQDLCKWLCYILLETYIFKDDRERAAAVASRAQITTMLATEDKKYARAVRRTGSSTGIGGGIGRPEDLERINKLESEIKLLKQVLIERGLLAAPAASAGGGAAAAASAGGARRHHH